MSDPVVKFVLIVSLILSCLIKVHGAEPKSLLFTVNSPGSFPYLYFDFTKQTYEGLIPDFFADLEQQEIFKIVYVDSNQLRSEQFVIDGKVDLYLANREWLKQPEKVIASQSIVHHLTFLYSLTPFEDKFSVEALVNKTVCTQQDYIYTGLQKLFKHKKLKRFDSSNQETIASMLAKGRCDYAILNDYNATSIFYETEFCHIAIYQSPQATSVIDLTILMRPELSEIKKIIDKHMQTFVSSGKADKSLLSHSPRPAFPKPITCR